MFPTALVPATDHSRVGSDPSPTKDSWNKQINRTRGHLVIVSSCYVVGGGVSKGLQAV